MLKTPTIEEIKKRMILDFKEEHDLIILDEELSKLKKLANILHISFFGKNKKNKRS